jgi:hypothetical protein
MLSKETKEKLVNALQKFGIELPATKVEPVITRLEDVALIDGTMLMVDKLEVGAKAEFMGADGIAIPAEGEFELADGSKVICAGGLIAEIMPKEVEAQPEPVNEMAAILSRLEAIEKSMTSNKASLETQMGEQSKAIEVALSAVNELAKVPVAMSLESQKPSKKTVKAYEDMTNHEKMLFNKGKI